MLRQTFFHIFHFLFISQLTMSISDICLTIYHVIIGHSIWIQLMNIVYGKIGERDGRCWDEMMRWLMRWLMRGFHFYIFPLTISQTYHLTIYHLIISFCRYITKWPWKPSNRNRLWRQSHRKSEMRWDVMMVGCEMIDDRLGRWW